MVFDSIDEVKQSVVVVILDTPAWKDIWNMDIGNIDTIWK